MFSLQYTTLPYYSTAVIVVWKKIDFVVPVNTCICQICAYNNNSKRTNQVGYDSYSTGGQGFMAVHKHLIPLLPYKATAKFAAS